MTRTVLAWVRLLGGLGILALLSWRLGTGAFLDGLRVLDGRMLAAAVAIGLLTTLFSAWRWCLVARGLGIQLPLGNALADYYRALFLNAALPGGVLGDVDRAVRNGKESGNIGRGVRAVVLERTAGQVVLVAVGVVLLLAQPSPVLSDAARVTIAQILGVALVAGALAVGLLAWARRRHGGSRWGRAIGTGFAEIRQGLLARRNWPGVLISSAVVLAGHLATFVLAARAAGSTASIARLAPLMLLALLAMALPLNIGGWGPREGVTAWAFSAAGMGATLGLTTAVVYGLFAFAASLPGAAVLLIRWIVRLRAMRPATTQPVRIPAAPARVAVPEPALASS